MSVDPFHQTDGAVGVDADAGAGRQADVHPVATGHPAAAVGTGNLGFVMIRVLRGLKGFYVADHPELRAVDPAVAFLAGVLQAELQRVHAALGGQFVNDLLAAEGGDGRARSAVGEGTRLVGDHVVALDPLILQGIGRKHALGAGGHG